MKRNNTLINNLGRAAMLVLVAGVASFMTGCKTFTIDAPPTARIKNVSDKKIALSIGLMLDSRYNTNHVLIRDGGVSYPFGPALRQQGISLCEQSFEKVIVSTNGVVPAGMDAILTPEMHRCGIGLSFGGKEDIVMLIQWTLRAGDNQNILWMATVDGHGNEGRPKVYEMLFDDLANKSYQAFRESPEIQRLVAKKSGTAM
jgi:hypothetical protein